MESAVGEMKAFHGSSGNFNAVLSTRSDEIHKSILKTSLNIAINFAEKQSH